MLGRFQEAVKFYTSALSLKPDSASVYAMRDELYRAMGKPALAQADYERACTLDDADACRDSRTRRKRRTTF